MCTRPIRLDQTKEVPRTVPCGFCIECRSRYARGWAMRCVHEASLHEQSCFGTLTYDDEHLPEHGTLVPRHFQLFMKRLRKSIAPKKVRFYHAGEYGEVNFRPHYHFLLFGYMPGELEAIPSKSAYTLFRSPELEKLWPFGLSSVGHVSFESASYVARYVMKKVDQVGRKKKWSVDPETGVAHEIEPEYSTMSRGGRHGRGLGFGWYEKYGEEVERLETVRLDGTELMPPRFYDGLFREREPVRWEIMKLRREVEALRKFRKNGRAEMTRERMAREVIAKAKLAQLERSL